MSLPRNSRQRCQARLASGRRYCHKFAKYRANGLDVCADHKRSIDRVFAEARQRWDDAGQPESDL